MGSYASKKRDTEAKNLIIVAESCDYILNCK